MDITVESMPWDSEDTALWRAFLETRTGARLLPKLFESIPPLLAGGDANSILIRTGDVRGFQSAARTLLTLAHPIQPGPAASPPGYADLNDDAAWPDGQKLTK